MSIRFNKDIFNNLVPPAYILTKANNDRLYTLNCTEKKYCFEFNAPDVIQFKTYMLMDNIKNQAYDFVVEGQFIEVEDIGRFIISNVNIESQSEDFECKSCEAISIETMLGQKYLELFTINMGTVESIDGVKFYNLADPGKSLLHLVLEKFPDWTIGHVDTSLMTVERCFEVTRQDVYSFLTQDVATAFQCIFLFDTIHQRINIYEEDTVGDDTDIFVTYDNLLKNTNISSSIDDIKTCLTVKGADELNLREVNMGYDKSYNLNYFHSPEFMSVGLYEAYSKWTKKWNDNITYYSSLLSQYQNFYNQINHLTNEKMSSDPNSTNWVEYGLVPLKEKLASYEQQQAVMIKAGQGNKDHRDYNAMYLPVYNTINSIKSQISIVESQLSTLRNHQSSIGTEMAKIINSISMNNNFTPEQLQELSKFVREDELSSSNFVVTDTMTDSERMDMLKEMLEFGQKELRKASQPQLQFTAEMLNLFEIKEFDNCCVDFEPGNYINIIIRDDYIVKARLLTIDMDFYNPNNFSVTFGNMNKVKGKNIYTDITKAIDTATSVATTVSFNSSNWNQANKDADDINKALASGLLAAGESIKTSKSDVTIDDRGIIVSNTPESKYPDDRIFIGDTQILFSDDDFKTIKTALGRVQYTKKGVTYNDFGLIAHLVLAGYVAGSVIEGTEFYGGLLQSLNYVSKKTGTNIDLNNGTFEFNANSESKLTLDENGILTVKGIIKAEEGWIGGQNAFIIKDGKIYCKKDSLTSNVDGVYIGIDGISLGSNSVLKLEPNGDITALRGNIGGAIIESNGIRASNNNWWIRSDGSSSFTDTYINNVRNGSHFGSVGYSEGTTWGTFGGASYFGSNVDSPFSGTTIPHIQTIAADYIKVNYLDAINADIRNLYAEDANIKNLIAENVNAINANIETLRAKDAEIENLVVSSVNAINANILNLQVKDAEIENLVATKATIEQLNATNAQIENLKASSISANRLTAGTVNGYSIDWKKVSVVQSISFSKSNVVTSVDFDTKSVGKASVLSGYSVVSRDIYVLCHIT